MKVLQNFTCNNQYFNKGSVLPDGALTDKQVKEAQSKGLLEMPRKAEKSKKG